MLNYNGWKDTIECLESLLSLDYANRQFIVVDNSSPNGSMHHLEDWAVGYSQSRNGTYTILDQHQAINTSISTTQADVVFIKSERNAGFAAGNNIAIKYALLRNDFQYLWLLNNDTIVEPDSLSELVKTATEDEANKKKIGIWGSKVLFHHRPDTIQAIGGKINFPTFTTHHIAENKVDSPSCNITEIDLDYVLGASMFVSEAFVQEVGLLNEDYFLYFEEIDWATRGKQKGYHLGYVCSSRVYHKEGQSIGSSSKGSRKSILADYHGIRSKILFVKKFYPNKIPQLYLFLFGSVILRLKRLQFKRAKQILSLMINTDY